MNLNECADALVGLGPSLRRSVAVLFVAAASAILPAAADADPVSWLRVESKSDKWLDMTARLRELLVKMDATDPTAQRWLGSLEYRCRVLNDIGEPEHFYTQLYAEQTTAMAEDLLAGRAPFARFAGQCIPYIYWSDHIRHLTGVRLVVPPGYDPAAEYQFFMYYKMGGGLVWKAGEKYVGPDAAGAVFQGPWHPSLETCRTAKDTFHAWSSLSSQVKGGKGAVQEFSEVVASLARDTAVSADRAFASGFSDGGYTSLWLGSRYPHLFAGIAPEVANWQHLNTEHLGLLNIPVLVVDGWMDAGYVTENVARFHALDNMGGDIELLIGMHGHTAASRQGQAGRPGAPFEDPATFSAIMDWAGTKRRNLWPKRVRYATWNLQWNRAYWLSIDGMADQAKSALIDAAVQEGNRIEVRQKNVQAFTLHLSEKLVDPAQGVTVAINGEMRYQGPFQEELQVEVSPAAAGKLRKSHAMPGDIMAAMDQASYDDDLGRVGQEVPGHVWRFVRPSGGTEAEKKIYDKCLPPWAIDDRDVDERIAREFHLCLYGGPAVNEYVDRIKDELPVKIEPGRFSIGGRVYDRPEHCVRFLHPNPRHPDRYLVIYAFNDLEAAARSDFYGAGSKFLSPTAYTLRDIDCQVFGVEPRDDGFGVDVAGSRHVPADFYIFDSAWGAPDQAALGTLEKEVDFCSLHVMKADAIKEAMGTDVAIVHALVPGSNRTRCRLEKGPVAYNDLATTHMFPEFIMTCEVTGAQLKEIAAEAFCTTLFRSEKDPGYDPRTSLLLSEIDDEKAYTLASDYTSSAGALSFGAQRAGSDVPAPAHFKSAAEFEQAPYAWFPCRDLRQTEVEVAEALAAYVARRGSVSPRPMTGDSVLYTVNPEIHEYPQYDWTHVKFNVDLPDPLRPSPLVKKESLAIGLAAEGAAGASPAENYKQFLRFDVAAGQTSLSADYAALRQRLPVAVRAQAARYGIDGSCNRAGAGLKLVPDGKATAGEAVLVKLLIENRGAEDLSGVAVLACGSVMGPRRNSWPPPQGPKKDLPPPVAYGLWDVSGSVKTPYQQHAALVLRREGIDLWEDLLVVRGAGYASGLVGIKKPISIKAGQTAERSLVFLAANAEDPANPQELSLHEVLLALQEQIETALDGLKVTHD